MFFYNTDVCLIQHGAAVIQDKMYIFGGNHNGRYCSDLQVREVLDHTLFMWKLGYKFYVQLG